MLFLWCATLQYQAVRVLEYTNILYMQIYEYVYNFFRIVSVFYFMTFVVGPHMREHAHP
jgi:hypothetical protein